MVSFRQVNISPAGSSDTRFSSLAQQTLNGFVKGDFYQTQAGSALQAIPVDGATEDDIAITVLKASGATPRRILTAAAVAGGIEVVMDGDPGTDHIISWILVTLT